jgi:peptidoglycan biosynthesis protein MviN/MurJ (putative lipid II flippase)
VKSVIIDRLAAMHPNHKRIATSAALIAILTIATKLFVAAREMAIAWRYGVGATVDAYQLALTVTTWMPMMLTSVMTVVLVPPLVELQRHPIEQRSFLAELNGTVLLLAALVAVLTYVAAPLGSALLASTELGTTLRLTDAMSQQMAPIALLIIVTGYLSVRLQSRERFAYTLTEICPAVAIALFVVVPGAAGGTARLVWGTLIGFFLQVLVLCAMTRRAEGGLGQLRFRHRSSQWQKLYGSVAVMAAAQIVLASTVPLDQAFAARIGAGAVATLGYANRIIILITGFGALVLARALLPVLSRAVGDGNHQLGARQARQWSWLLLAFGLCAGAALWLLAPWGVSLVFQRGAFTHDDSEAVAHVLRFGALQLPFYFAGLTAVQWIAARRRYGSLLLIACLAVLLKLVMNLLLIKAFGLAGIMMATAGMYAFSFTCQYFAAQR